MSRLGPTGILRGHTASQGLQADSITLDSCARISIGRTVDARLGCTRLEAMAPKDQPPRDIDAARRTRCSIDLEVARTPRVTRLDVTRRRVTGSHDPTWAFIFVHIHRSSLRQPRLTPRIGMVITPGFGVGVGAGAVGLGVGATVPITGFGACDTGGRAGPFGCACAVA